MTGWLTSPTVAAASIAAMFVGSLYVCVPAHVRRMRRSEPTQIAWRMFAVIIASCVAPVMSTMYLYASDRVALWGMREWFGLQWECNARPAVYQCVVAITCLFAGLLVYMVMEDPDSGSAGLFRQYAALISEVPALGWLSLVRNLVVGPFVEEWVFRFCILPIYLAAGYSPAAAIGWTSIWFGVAHVHHVVNMQRLGMPIRTIAAAIASQLGYTTLFGLLSGYFAHRTGSLWGVVAMHSVANAMGFPPLEWIISSRVPGGKKMVLGIAYLAGIGMFLIMAARLHPGAYPCSMPVPPPR